MTVFQETILWSTLGFIDALAKRNPLRSAACRLSYIPPQKSDVLEGLEHWHVDCKLMTIITFSFSFFYQPKTLKNKIEKN